MADEISSDQYKVETCSITNDECTGFSCRTCETATEHVNESKKEEKQTEFEGYTIFTKLSKINILSVHVNSFNTICMLDLNTVQQLQKEKIISITPKPYHPDHLKQYPALRKFRQYNHFEIPDEIWTDKDKPAVFRWGEAYYLIAPRIEDDHEIIKQTVKISCSAHPHRTRKENND